MTNIVTLNEGDNIHLGLNDLPTHIHIQIGPDLPPSLDLIDIVAGRRLETALLETIIRGNSVIEGDVIATGGGDMLQTLRIGSRVRVGGNVFGFSSVEYFIDE